MCIDGEHDLEGLLDAGRVVHACLEEMRAAVRAGITTAELDAIGARVLSGRGARPAPALVYGFPAATCISVNDEVVHGIPSERRLAAGDLLKLDVTVEKNGYMADAAITMGVGAIDGEGERLIACARAAFQAGAHEARAGRSVRRIGRAIEQVTRAAGFTVVQGLSGHGIGRAIHEPPNVPNFDDPDADAVLVRGMVITIEPILTCGDGRAFEDFDHWTIRTVDRRRASHYEHTLVVTDGDPILLTAA